MSPDQLHQVAVVVRAAIALAGIIVVLSYFPWRDRR